MASIANDSETGKRPTPLYTRRCRLIGWSLIYLSTGLARLGLASASMHVGVRGLKLIERGEKFRHGLLDDGGQP